MSIERLRKLEMEYWEWYTTDKLHAMSQAEEVMEHLPKLLAVVEAAKELSKWLPCGPSVKTEEIKAWSNMDQALDAILSERWL